MILAHHCLPAEYGGVHEGNIGVRPLQEGGEQHGGGHFRPSLAAHVHRVPRADREEGRRTIGSILVCGAVKSRAFPGFRSDFLRDAVIIGEWD